MREPLALPGGDSLTFIGTATVLLRLGPFTVLTDPNFLHRGQWCYFGQGLFDRVARRDLAADVPVLTTAHAAHRLSRKGFRETVALETWASETLTDGDASITVTAVPARHAPRPLDRVLPPVMGSIWTYTAGPGAKPLRIYVSGDTVVHDELRQIHDRYPDVDLAIVHLGGTRVLGVLVTMDDRQGVALLEMLRPAHAVPVHFDDYANFTSPVSNFLQAVAARGTATAVRMLRRGESLPLSELH
ncbi:MBL fold metallo-hydrolase [Amycolatopsis sacchari]|uniref:L-ascorbate metabolism protein UlaG, beta-lactamase superfamily n=1 Tax=Amycolatopsis sacchari TaxID=115433 RepID=A0A1I3XHM1_9PSEU|nr:MBL fold metallo-hydrolase [Amycolatopsis sacchari]SFK18970.1 L-ascorbate metabolism protein UlaG, beta-lactamase superfamily [Amycolatopsis sacchari]